MSLQRSAFSRFRPRALTLAVAVLGAAILALANLSHEVSRRRLVPETSLPEFVFDLREPGEGDRYAAGNVSRGWPLLWRQSVIVPYMGRSSVAGQCYSATRLAADLAMWLVMLAAPAGACEWFLRRYRPRLRWSLRTMLAGIGLLAAGCGWFASARDRANLRDQVIGLPRGPGVAYSVLVERWGPKWLEAIGADRYCCRITGVTVSNGAYPPEQAQIHHDTLLRIKRLRDLQYLSCEMDAVLPDALAELRRLKVLGIDGSHWDFDKRMSQELLAAIGNMAQLEHLRLWWMVIDGESASSLSGLKSLKSLSFNDVAIAGSETSAGPMLLACLPELPKLEAIILTGTDVRDGDLAQLAKFPKLKSLNLQFTDVTAAGLPQLASLEWLEELAVDSNALTPAGLRALSALNRLQKLHVNKFRCDPPTDFLALDDGGDFEVPEGELEAYRRAFSALRRSHPGIVFDDNDDLTGWQEENKVLSQYPFHWEDDASPDGFLGCWKWRKEQR